MSTKLILEPLTPSTRDLTSALAAAYGVIRLSFANTLITRTRFPYRNPDPGPNPSPSDDLAKYVADRLRADPSFRIVVVRDAVAGGAGGNGEGNEDSEAVKGEIIAVATYNVYRTQEDLVTWLEHRSKRDDPVSEGSNIEACREFRDLIIAGKRQYLVGEGKWGTIILDTLSTNPKHQRRGAGKMLVDWGTQIADDMHLPIYLEASLQGEPLYRKCGFERRGVWKWDVSRFKKAEKLPEEKGAEVNEEEGEDLVVLGLMIRDPR